MTEMNKRLTKIAILGGYGNTGAKIATHLARLGDFEISILGRDTVRATEQAARIKAVTGAPVSGGRADAADPASLRSALAGVDLVLSATSDTEHSADVARFALELGCDYADTHLSSPKKWAVLRALGGQISDRGLCFISDGGAHPGLPAAMVRAVGAELALEAAAVFGSFNIDWAGLNFGSNAPDDFVAELRDISPTALVDGQWTQSWQNLRRHDFGPPANSKDCIAMNLEEMRALPNLFPTLRETGFFVGGFGRRIDMAVMPACLLALKLWPGQSNRIGRAFLGAMKRWAPKTQWAILDLQAKGQRDKQSMQVAMRVADPDAYELTALAVVATLVQYRQTPRRPGLWTQAEFIDPAACFEFLAAHGVHVRVETSEGPNVPLLS
jgi:saccharopine dehydrogenase (NAD+, L-lysine-forming)